MEQAFCEASVAEVDLAAPRLPLLRLELAFVIDEPVVLPPFRGHLWRGILGPALKRIDEGLFPGVSTGLIESGTLFRRLFETPANYRRYWWRFAERRSGLYAALRPLSNFFALSRVSPQFGIARLSSKLVPAESTVAFAFGGGSPFATLQSRVHEIWARFLASSLKDDLRYTPSDCFETFPFPEHFETSPFLEATGQAYHDHRAALMIARNEGMTKTYNRFHDPDERSEDIIRLRELHAEMDGAVLRAYGWDDLAARAEPIFLNETDEDDHTYQGRLFWPSAFRDEVLGRLLALNAERHAEEVRLGTAPGTSRPGRSADEKEKDHEAAE